MAKAEREEQRLRRRARRLLRRRLRRRLRRKRRLMPARGLARGCGGGGAKADAAWAGGARAVEARGRCRRGLRRGEAAERRRLMPPHEGYEREAAAAEKAKADAKARAERVAAAEKAKAEREAAAEKAKAASAAERRRKEEVFRRCRGREGRRRRG